MARRPNSGPVVVDTDVFSARLLPNSTLARRDEPLLVGRVEFVSFQTVAEVRYGALLRGWGTARPRRMETGSPEPRSFPPGATSFGPTPSFASPVSALGMPCASANTTPIDGSQPPRFRLGVPLVSNDTSSTTPQVSRSRPRDRRSTRARVVSGVARREA